MFEDTKRVIRSRNSKKDREYNEQMKNDNNKKDKTMVDKILHTKTQTEVNSGSSEGKTDFALLLEPVVLLLSKLRCWPVVNEGNVGIMITTNEVSSVVICDIYSVVVN
jgi:hypothetical protein